MNELASLLLPCRFVDNIQERPRYGVNGSHIGICFRPLSEKSNGIRRYEIPVLRNAYKSHQYRQQHHNSERNTYTYLCPLDRATQGMSLYEERWFEVNLIKQILWVRTKPFVFEVDLPCRPVERRFRCTIYHVS